jgi:DNA-binding MarR family transcriptional regulator
MELRLQLNEFLTDIFNGILKIEEQSIKKSSDATLSIAELHIIEKIGDAEVIRMSQLAKALNVTVGTVTVSVDRLQKKGFIERSRIENDRRVVILKLTAKGGAAYRLHQKFHNKMIDGIVVGLSENEEEVLSKALSNLAKFFKELKV